MTIEKQYKKVGKKNIYN